MPHSISSQRIHKFRVLSICQIPELNPLFLHVPRRSPHAFPLFVLPQQVTEQKQHINNASREKYNNGDLGRDVAWTVLCTEGLRADDVANAVGDEEDGGHGGFLGVATHPEANISNDGCWKCTKGG